jgi:hypothetical protein
MFLKDGLPAPDKLKMAMPHLPKPISVRRAKRKFPILVEELDGSAEECTLLWFYKVQEGMLVFKDGDAEDEMAELLGVKVMEVEFADIDDSKGSDKAMTPEEVAAFKEMLAENREALYAADSAGARGKRRRRNKRPCRRRHRRSCRHMSRHRSERRRMRRSRR